MAVSAITVASADFSDDTAVVSVPPGAVEGDLIFFSVQYQGTGAVIWPDGFNELKSVEDTYVGSMERIAVRVATGTESASDTFAAGLGGYQEWCAACALVKGYNLPIEDGDVLTTQGYGRSLSLTGNPVSTSGPGRLVLWFGSTANSGPDKQLTPPEGLTLGRLVDNGDGVTLAVASGVQASAGTQTYSGTMECSDDVGWATNVITLALAPAGAPPDPGDGGDGDSGSVSKSLFANPFTSGPWGPGPWLTTS